MRHAILYLKRAGVCFLVLLLCGLAPQSRVEEDAVGMTVAGVLRQLQGMEQPSEADETAMRSMLKQAFRLAEQIYVDPALPIRVFRSTKGTVMARAMLWLDGRPISVYSDGTDFEIRPATLPRLVDRVRARGRLLSWELPPGPVKTFIDTAGEQGWRHVIVFGGEVRNLLLERQDLHGDFDIIYWVRPGEEEKAQAAEEGIPPRDLHQLLWQRQRDAMAEYYGMDPRTVHIEGIPLDPIGVMEEDTTFQGGFAGTLIMPMARLIGVSINRIGIDPITLEIFDPSDGLKDLAEGRVRISGELFAERLPMGQYFRFLRLSSQLQAWGFEPDPDSQALVDRTFEQPYEGELAAVMHWVQDVISLKDHFPDLELEIQEVRRREAAGGDARDAMRSIAEMIARHEKIKKGLDPDSVENEDILASLPRASRLVKDWLVEIDLARNVVAFDTFGIGSEVLDLYQGANDPEAITRKLRETGSEPLLQALGIELDQFTAYAYRVLIRDRLGEMHFEETTRVGKRTAEFWMGDRIVKVPLRANKEGKVPAELEEGYRIGETVLGGHVLPTTVLSRVRVPKEHVADPQDFMRRYHALEEGDAIVLPWVAVQEVQGKPLPVVAQEMFEAGRMRDLRQLIRNFVLFHMHLWARGVILTSYGMDIYYVDGEKILLYGVGSLRHIDARQDYAMNLQELRQETEAFFDSLAGALGDRFRRLADGLISVVDLEDITAMGDEAIPAEVVHWPRPLVRRTGPLDASL